MTKHKKIPPVVICARCYRTIPKSESCSWRMGRNYSRLCQECARVALGFEPKKQEP